MPTLLLPLSPPSPDSTQLSDYEKCRAHNIERNNQRLRALGLISAREEETSNALAWGRRQPGSLPTAPNKKDDKDDDQNDNSTKEKKSKRQKKKRDALTQPSISTSPARKSARLQGMDPERTEGFLELDHEHDTKMVTMDSPSQQQERKRQRQSRAERVQECRLVRQRLALTRVMEDGEVKAGNDNPTATYDHCWMRVRTMTHKGLQNRIKAIERAAGKHCVVKMAIFKSCLQDENLWDLADLASAALERLKALQPPPSPPPPEEE